MRKRTDIASQIMQWNKGSRKYMTRVVLLLVRSWDMAGKDVGFQGIAKSNAIPARWQS